MTYRGALAVNATPCHNGNVSLVTQLPRRRTRLVRAGAVYIAVVIVIGLAAASRPNNLLVWVFSALVAAMIISTFASGILMRRVRALRIEPRRGRVGEPLIVRYEIRNISRYVPVYDLHAHEVLTSERLRCVGDAWILHAGPRDTVHAESVFQPMRRGPVRLCDFEVSTTFPFGLLRRVLRFAQSGDVLIHPEIRFLRHEILARVTAGGVGGQRLASSAGGGDDYFGVREYRAGDSVRQIAWKRLAGTGRLATIERSRAVPPRVRVLLDLRSPTDSLRVTANERARDLEESAIVLAASLLSLADRMGYEFALSVAGVDLPPIALRRGHFHREKLMSLLAALDLDAPRTVGNGIASSDERATIIAVHPDRSDTTIAPRDSWHFTARQLESMCEITRAASESTPHADASSVSAAEERA